MREDLLAIYLVGEKMDWYVIAGWLAAGVLLFVLFLAYSGAFHVVTFCYSQPYKVSRLRVCAFTGKCDVD